MGGTRSCRPAVPAVPGAVPDTGSGAAAPPLPAAGGSDARGAPGVSPHGHAGELRAEPGREALWEAAPVRWQRGDLLELGPGHVPVGHPGFPPPCQGLRAAAAVPGGILQPALHAGRLQDGRGAGENLGAVPPGQPRHAEVPGAGDGAGQAEDHLWQQHGFLWQGGGLSPGGAGGEALGGLCPLWGLWKPHGGPCPLR